VVLGALLESSRIAHSFIIISEMAASMEQHYRPSRHLMGRDVRLSIAVARTGSSLDFIQANRIRTLAIDGLKDIFEEVDVIVTPNTALPAPKIGHPSGESNVGLVGELMRFAFLANLTGLPAIAIPTDYLQIHDGAKHSNHGDFLPLAVQVIGRWWEEHVLLKIAFVLEKNLLQKRKPKILHNVL